MGFVEDAEVDYTNYKDVADQSYIKERKVELAIFLRDLYWLFKLSPEARSMRPAQFIKLFGDYIRGVDNE